MISNITHCNSYTIRLTILADTAEITPITTNTYGYISDPSPTISYNHVHLNNTSSWPSLGTTSSVEATSQPSPPSISVSQFNYWNSCFKFRVNYAPYDSYSTTLDIC